MLDRIACIKQLHEVVESLFPVKTQEVERLLHCWDCLVNDVEQHAIRDTLRRQKDVTWCTELGIGLCKPFINAYTIIAVDGSQIYPDRHQGLDCFLLNISSVEINYRLRDAHVRLSCQPHLFAPTGQRIAQVNVEQINALRYCYELQQLHQVYGALLTDQPSGVPLVALFDGTLLLWHLQRAPGGDERHAQALKLNALLREQQAWYAGYISSPRSSDIVQLLQWYGTHILKDKTGVTYCVDADLFAKILQPGHVTNWFLCPKSAYASSLDSLSVCFAYMHVANEIARIEVPAWIASDLQLSDLLLSVIASQIKKGRGYPVSLAEAHEQAVIKGADRDFFYTQLWQMVERRNLRVSSSQKAFKKRVRGI